MNTVLRLIRKDFVGRRGPILVWLLLCVLGLLRDLGLVGAAPVGPGSYGLGTVLAEMLQTFSWIMICVVVIPTVREDTPAIRERFLSTRPVSARSLWLAKALFLTLVVVVPYLARLVVYLVVSGQDLRVVLLGTLELALWSVPAVALIAAFVSLWSSWTRGFIAAVVLVAIGWGTLALVDGFSSAVNIERRIVSGPVAPGLGLLVAALGFLFFTFRRRALLLGMGVKLAASVVILAAALAAFLFTPVNPREVDGTGPVVGLPASGEIAPLDATVHYNSYTTPKMNGLTVSIQPARPAGLKPGQEIVWRIPTTICNGETLTQRVSDPVSIMAESGMNRTLRLPVVSAVEGHLGREVNWFVSEHNSGWGSLSPPHSSPVPVGGRSEEGFRFSAELKGAVYQWELVADLPLKAGGTTTTGRETWSVLNVGNNRSYSFYAIFRNSRPELWLSKRWDERLAAAARFRRDTAVVFYDPTRQRAFMDTGFSIRQQRKDGSGYVRRTYTLAYHGNDDPRRFFEQAGEDLRLLILRPRYVTTIARHWKAPNAVRPASLASYRGGGLARRDRTLTPGQFFRWFDGLEKPAPDAPAGLVTPYLVKVLEKSAQCRSRLERDDPVVRELAEYVPRHFDLFLRAKKALASDNYVPSELIIHVLIQGMGEAQTPRLVEALRSDMSLVEVLEGRGWTAGAVPQLRELLESGRQDSRIVKVLARHGALEDYLPGLLKRLERQPSTTLYSQLRAIPGIEDRLDRAVRAMWDAHARLLMSDPLKSAHLRVALWHGAPEAVEAFHRLAQEAGRKGHGDRHYVRDLLDQFFALEGISQADQHREEIVVPWFLERRPADFRFDAVSRSFAHAPQSF